MITYFVTYNAKLPTGRDGVGNMVVRRDRPIATLSDVRDTEAAIRMGMSDPYGDTSIVLLGWQRLEEEDTDEPES